MGKKNKGRKRIMSKREKAIFKTRINADLSPEHEKKLASVLQKVAASNTTGSFIDCERKFRSTVPPSYLVPIVRDHDLDNQLHHEWNLKRGRYCPTQVFRSQLPVHAMKNEILEMINENQVSLISGETGSGKTTQVAQFILDQHIEQKRGSACHIICTQPRRISAISVAQRIAEERGEKLGESCGYHVRLDSVAPRPQGSILFCTPGVVMKTMITDPTVSRATHMIIDEVHERDVYTDFLLILVKEFLLKQAYVKVILMSATSNADSFSSYFGGCPTFTVPGRTHPVKEVYLEELLQLVNYKAPARNPEPIHMSRDGRKRWQRNQWRRDGCRDYPEYLSSMENHLTPEVIENLKNMDYSVTPSDLILAIVAYICERSQDHCAILIFFPGWSDIEKLMVKFNQDSRFNNRQRFLILPIHSMLDSTLQKDVFAKPQPGCRKIILGTNIVETSVTIDDVVYVIDTGKCKEYSYDAEVGFATLRSEWVSKASLTQRQGRAGRVKPGICYRLFTQHHKKSFKEFPIPDIVKTPLLPQLCLTLKVLKIGKAWPFLSQALTPPSESSCKIALQQLQQMQALDSNENLTVTGHCLAWLPVSPNIGRMVILSALFSCLDPILTIATAVEGKDVSTNVQFDDAGNLRIVKKKDEKTLRDFIVQECSSDHLTLIHLVTEWEGLSGNDQAQRAYAEVQDLQNEVLHSKVELKCKIMWELKNLGFVDVVDPKDPSCNANSGNIALLKAMMCAGLYPNVAYVKPHHRTKDAKEKCRRACKEPASRDEYKETFGAQDITAPFIKTTKIRNIKSNLPQLHIHSCSYAKDYIDKSCQYILFSELIRVEYTYNIYHITPVTPYPLLFFGGCIEYRHGSCIALDGHEFSGCQTTVQRIQDVRKQLDQILMGKVCNAEEGQLGEDVLRAIVDIITSEAKPSALEGADAINEVEETIQEDQDDAEDSDDPKLALAQEPSLKESPRESKICNITSQTTSSVENQLSNQPNNKTSSHQQDCNIGLTRVEHKVNVSAFWSQFYVYDARALASRFVTTQGAYLHYCNVNPVINRQYFNELSKEIGIGTTRETNRYKMVLRTNSSV